MLENIAPVGILENDIAHYENVDPGKNMENVDPEKIEERIAFENPKNLENLMNPWRNKRRHMVFLLLLNESHPQVHSQQMVLPARADSLLVKTLSLTWTVYPSLLFSGRSLLYHQLYV